jgi:diguanylate cyclase (GGDEF)-like protein
LAAAFFVCLAVLAATPFQCLAETERVLTTARGAHDLPLEEARKGYRVQLKAVATYYDPFIDKRHAALFVQDASGGIFVSVTSPPASGIQAGDLVEIEGRSATGDYAPIVTQAAIRVLEHSHLPARAPAVSYTELLSGEYDGQWVQVAGIVRSIQSFGKNVSLWLAMSDGELTATTIREPGADYSRLIDAKVSIQANAAPAFNRKLQMTGVRLLFPSLLQVKIDQPAPTDPFTQAPIPIANLLRFTPGIAYQHRVHVRGRVTLYWPGRSLCIQDEAGDGLCVQIGQTEPAGLGQIVHVAGFAAIGSGGLSPTLKDAVFRIMGPGATVSPMPVSLAQAFQGDVDGRLIQLEGQVIANEHASKDPTLLLASGKYLFPVILPSSIRRFLPEWRVGSFVRVRGICSVQAQPDEMVREGFKTPEYFKILVRSERDLTILRRPSWWTPEHLLPVLGVVLLMTLAALGWVAILRSRVAQQSAVIREQNATLQGLSFQDGLTGIANRRKFDEMLEREFANCARFGVPLSLVLMDIDFFKALNDRYGHQFGDECLVGVARALTSVVTRSTDLVARYGGEEFAVVLPGCGVEATMVIAERMREAVLDLKIASGDPAVHAWLSVSMGTASALPDARVDRFSLVAAADAALYESKQNGRNRVTAAREENATELVSDPEAVAS